MKTEKPKQCVGMVKHSTPVRKAGDDTVLSGRQKR